MATVPYLQVVDATIQIALAPSQIDQPLQAVKAQLNNMLFKYHDRIGGIPLCYGDFLFSEGKKYGRFYADHPWVHIDINCELTVFRPSLGDKIVGKVTKVSESNVALLIFALFNANISNEELLKKQYKYNAGTQSWNSKNVTIKEGDAIEFVVNSYQYANGVINILGSL